MQLDVLLPVQIDIYIEHFNNCIKYIIQSWCSIYYMQLNKGDWHWLLYNTILCDISILTIDYCVLYHYLAPPDVIYKTAIWQSVVASTIANTLPYNIYGKVLWQVQLQTHCYITATVNCCGKYNYKHIALTVIRFCTCGSGSLLHMSESYQRMSWFTTHSEYYWCNFAQCHTRQWI